MIGYVEVEWPVGPGDPFFNINEPADLAEAERRMPR
jgi:molybdopterin-guanine dinucleotide biosynthesis protein A